MENLGPQVMAAMYLLKQKRLDIPLFFRLKLTLAQEGRKWKFPDQAKNSSEAPLAMAKKESEVIFQFPYIQ